MTAHNTHSVKFKWTAARRLGLCVLVNHGGTSVYSNRTSPGENKVYWQTADWMRNNGIVTQTWERLTLTELGWVAAKEFEGYPTNELVSKTVP